MATKKRKSFVSPRTARNWTLVSGLVQIPIGLAKVYEDVGSERISGTKLCAEHENPINQQKVCTRLVKGKQETHVIESDEDLVTGYEYDKGKYAILTGDEVRALPVEHDGIINLVACVNDGEVDDTIYEGSYFAFPTEDATVENYAILLDWLERSGKTLIAVGGYYTTTRAFAISAKEGVVIVKLCNYAANFKAEALKTIQAIELPEITRQNQAQADAFFGGLPNEMDWEQVTDTKAERQQAVIAEKVKKGTVAVPEEVEEVSVGEVPDIFEAMRAEIEQHSKKAKQPKGKSPTASRKRTPARR